MIISQREEIRATQKRMLDSAVSRKRELTPTENIEYDLLEANLRSCGEALQRLNGIDAQNARNDAVAAEWRSGAGSEHQAVFKSTEDRAIEDQFRSAMLEKNPAPIFVRGTAPRSYYSPGVEARAMAALQT
jgi:hypothetical protein